MPKGAYPSPYSPFPQMQRQGRGLVSARIGRTKAPLYLMAEGAYDFAPDLTGLRSGRRSSQTGSGAS